MTARELLKPRFEVIDLYPFSKIDKGIILTEEVIHHYSFEKDGRKWNTSIKNLDKYPHLFRKLNWWENRVVSEMPIKLKCLVHKDNDSFDLEKEEVLLIVSWDMKNKRGFLSGFGGVCNLEAFTPEYGYIPVD